MGTATAVAGLFDTAEEAAVWLAVVKRDMKAHHNGKLFAPPKIDKPHKPRAKPAVPAMASPVPLQPPQLPMGNGCCLRFTLPPRPSPGTCSLAWYLPFTSTTFTKPVLPHGVRSSCRSALFSLATASRTAAAMPLGIAKVATQNYLR